LINLIGYNQNIALEKVVPTNPLAFSCFNNDEVLFTVFLNKKAVEIKACNLQAAEGSSADQ
jgi:hypothetical protein